MLGLLIGTACLIALFKVAGCGHRYAMMGPGGGCSRGGFRGRHHRHWEGPGFGERTMLRWLFERLDTTHGQEKVILEAVEEVKKPLKEAKEEWRGTFHDVAEAMRAPEFDHERIATTWVDQDKALEQARLALTTSLTRIHDALDEKQRKILADLIEQGPWSRGGWR